MQDVYPNTPDLTALTTLLGARVYQESLRGATKCIKPMEVEAGAGETAKHIIEPLSRLKMF